MIKVVGLLKRKPGMTRKKFREYYETHHRLIGEKYLKGYAVKYMRRYLIGFADPLTGHLPDFPYDVIMEIWYPSQTVFEEVNTRFLEPKIAEEIAEDEDKLFDREKNTFFVVDEVESEL